MLTPSSISPQSSHPVRRAVVVGGGPAGQATAVMLAELGADVTVIEKRDHNFCRQVNFNMREEAMTRLEQLGVDDWAGKGAEIVCEEHRQARLDADGHALEESLERVVPEARHPQTLCAAAMMGSTPTYHVRTDVLETNIYDEARALGVRQVDHGEAELTPEVVEGHLLYHVQLRGQDGGVQDLGRPDLVVVADGSNSPTRASLGIAVKEETAPTLWVGAHIRQSAGARTVKLVETLPDGQIRREMLTGNAAAAGSWGFVEVDEAHRQAPPAELKQYFTDQISKVADCPVTAADIDWGAADRLVTAQGRRAEHVTAGENVIMVGDATRSGCPWYSGGVNTAIAADTVNAEALVRSLNAGQDAVSALQAYEEATQAASSCWIFAQG